MTPKGVRKEISATPTTTAKELARSNISFDSAKSTGTGDNHAERAQGERRGVLVDTSSTKLSSYKKRAKTNVCVKEKTAKGNSKTRKVLRKPKSNHSTRHAALVLTKKIC